jgi:hypothetical protein
MPWSPRVRDRLSYANVVSTLCLFLLLGGGAYASTHLPKNSVGPRQLRKGAVKAGKIAAKAVGTGKIRREAVRTGKLAAGAVATDKLADDAVTGGKVDESTLGTVPLAEKANTIAAPEGWHEVGAADEPAFQNGWKNLVSPPPTPETVAFYKDREGVVHLKGAAAAGAVGTTVFELPPGFRPASGRVLFFPAVCTGCAAADTGVVRVYGADIPIAGRDGAVFLPAGTLVVLDGIAFRAAA